MKIVYTSQFEKKLKKKLKKDSIIKQKFANQLKLLSKNFIHPSLKTHKLRGERIDQYSIWIHDNIRITFILENDSIILTDIINHDQY